MIKHAIFILLLGYLSFASLNAKAQNNISYVKLLGELQYLISQKQFDEAYKSSQKHYKYFNYFVLDKKKWGKNCPFWSLS